MNNELEVSNLKFFFFNLKIKKTNLPFLFIETGVEVEPLFIYFFFDLK